MCLTRRAFSCDSKPWGQKTETSNFADNSRGSIAAHGIDVSVPGDRDVVIELHRIIQQELTFNDIRSESKRYVIEQLQAMIDSGVEGVILGCTEFPLFDTTHIHAASLVDFVLDRN